VGVQLNIIDEALQSRFAYRYEKKPPLLNQLRPASFHRWRNLPIFGSWLDEFLLWMHEAQHYSLTTLDVYLSRIASLARWLQAHQVFSLGQVTLQQLRTAHNHFIARHDATSNVLGVLQRFLSDTGRASEGQAPCLGPVEREIQDYSSYLSNTRGLVERTVRNHGQQLRGFLKFLRFDHGPRLLRQLQRPKIEVFMRHAARTNNRSSLQSVVAMLRTFLRWRHTRGLLSRPLHLQIDTPRVYRGEQLPRALPWHQVQELLRSIDRSEPKGQRDFAMLYLTAAYGLRSAELVQLTLDDIDWQRRTLRIRRTKNKRALELPLTDEAATILIGYLRKARLKSNHRHLFQRVYAPGGPMQRTALREVLAERIRRSGLALPSCGAHVLRHSFAMRMVQQGLSFKAIGDALGHRDIQSTSAYIRLDVESLREVALRVPDTASSHPPVLIPPKNLLRIRGARLSRRLPKHLHSWLSSAIQSYLDLKRSLGCVFRTEAKVLAHWDHFVHRHYPRSRRIRPQMFAEWCQELATLSSTVSRARQRIVRDFLRHYAREHHCTFIPDRQTFPKPAPAVSPRLISEAEMARVLMAAEQLPPTAENPLRAQTVRIGLILLFCCGLRRGELLRLKLGDIDKERATLSIRLTKFHKSRLTPLSPSLMEELQRYLEARRQKNLPTAPDSFLMWSQRRTPEVYCPGRLLFLWHQLCVSAGVLNGQGHPPRLHDLRHHSECLIIPSCAQPTGKRRGICRFLTF
jgi:integrase/recombinase XerD